MKPFTSSGTGSGGEGIEPPTHSLIAGSMAKYVELLTIKLKAVETIAYKFTWLQIKISL